jgi:hypothetical protein
MSFKRLESSRRKITASVAATVAAIALALGGLAIADSGSGSGASAGAANATAGKVIPFHRGEPSAATKMGQVPANWKAGSGTLVTTEAAEKAKAAALAAYPGGTVNRVVAIEGGEYNVHMIGVNWPHHVFVNSSFKVVGAE